MFVPQEKIDGFKWDAFCFYKQENSIVFVRLQSLYEYMIEEYVNTDKNPKYKGYSTLKKYEKFLDWKWKDKYRVISNYKLINDIANKAEKHYNEKLSTFNGEIVKETFECIELVNTYLNFPNHKRYFIDLKAYEERYKNSVPIRIISKPEDVEIADDFKGDDINSNLLENKLEELREEQNSTFESLKVEISNTKNIQMENQKNFESINAQMSELQNNINQMNDNVNKANESFNAEIENVSNSINQLSNDNKLNTRIKRVLLWGLSLVILSAIAIGLYFGIKRLNDHYNEIKHVDEIYVESLGEYIPKNSMLGEFITKWGENSEPHIVTRYGVNYYFYYYIGDVVGLMITAIDGTWIATNDVTHAGYSMSNTKNPSEAIVDYFIRPDGNGGLKLEPRTGYEDAVKIYGEKYDLIQCGANFSDLINEAFNNVGLNYYDYLYKDIYALIKEKE